MSGDCHDGNHDACDGGYDVGPDVIHPTAHAAHSAAGRHSIDTKEEA